MTKKKTKNYLVLRGCESGDIRYETGDEVPESEAVLVFGEDVVIHWLKSGVLTEVNHDNG